MAAGDLIKLVVNQTLQNSVVQNVLYYDTVTDPPSGSAAQDCAEQFLNLVITTSWLQTISDELTVDCISAQKVFPTPIEALLEVDVSLTGQKTGESLPAMDSVLFQKVNLLTAGVGKRGRIYLAGLPEIDTKQGRVANDAKPALEALALSFQEELALPARGVFTPHWATRDPVTPFAINGSVKVDVVTLLPRIATQRRRRTSTAAFVV